MINVVVIINHSNTTAFPFAFDRTTDFSYTARSSNDYTG